jgi:SAM-dependent methyltransferase
MTVSPGSGSPPEDAENIQYYAILVPEEWSVYRLHPEEKYLVGKYCCPGDTILDLGCGAGRTTLPLHEMGYSVVGVDRPEILIAAARRRLPYLDLRVGSFLSIDAPDEFYSSVLIFSSAIDLAVSESERMTALRESARVLRKGGTLIYACHNLKSMHLFSPCHWRRPIWKLRHCFKAFRAIAPFTESDIHGRLHGLCAAPETVVRQTEEAGFKFMEMIGPAMSTNPLRNRYLSVNIHYAFRKV